MVVGLLKVQLHVPEAQSLKDKRSAVKRLKAQMRGKFNVAVAEVGGQGTWQRAVIGISTVAQDAATVRKRLEAAVSFVESLHLAEVMASDIEMLDTPPVAPLEEEGGSEPLPWEED